MPTAHVLRDDNDWASRFPQMFRVRKMLSTTGVVSPRANAECEQRFLQLGLFVAFRSFHSCGKRCGKTRKAHVRGFHPMTGRWRTLGGYGRCTGESLKTGTDCRQKCLWIVRPDMESLGDMRSFYGHSNQSLATASVEPAPRTPVPDFDLLGTRARVAVYEAPGAAPRVEEVEPRPTGEYIEELTTTVHRLAREQGSDIPYTVVREVTENFIHARFAEPVVSILDAGRTIRFADQGPGIADKTNAVLPGFTTAAGDMKRYIRGVGSGLPLVRDFLTLSGGTLVIEDNLGTGSVVTICSHPQVRPSYQSPSTAPEGQSAQYSAAPFTQQLLSPPSEPVLRLPTRQQQVLALVMETGLVGPSMVAKELGVGVSTAYRDLASLEEADLIEADGGKRTLTEKGLLYISEYMAR